MLVITGWNDEENRQVRLTVSRDNDNRVVLRFYEPVEGDYFSDELEGRKTGSIRLNLADSDALSKNL
jgi:hypothetical protein